MDRYPPIADHGLVGVLQTAALISSRGVVDWFAAPRFDSPSIFAALLDHDNGGYFQLALHHPESSGKQLYYPDTAILVTRFVSSDGVGEVIDFMPPDRTRKPTDRHTLVRAVRAVRGTADFTLVCRPRFDYGRAAHRLELDGDSAVFRAPDVGRLPQARYTFEKMQMYANHVGLFAEEIGPSGEQLGNFPQAFTHLSLIMAATALDRALDDEQGR
ncbi:hypothetical protein GA0115233_102244 [Streptomyces sp. DI166]|nr:hypothetical protein GA0115233_102244 [Streptomyces sp. DI166]